MRVSVLSRLALVLAFVLPLAAAPAIAADEGPDRDEALMEDARIREFASFFPTEPGGWVRDLEPDVFLSDTASTLSFTYLSLTQGGVGFTITLTFSNDVSSQYKKMMRSEEERTTWGFDRGKIGDWRALTAIDRGVNKADYVVILSNSRVIAVAPASNVPLPSHDEITRIFGSLDFAAIAAKD